MKRIIFAVIAAFTISTVWAHSGGTDSSGCHSNHKTGERHCH